MFFIFYYDMIHRMTMTWFMITLYGQCCRIHVVGQQIVSDISPVRSCWSMCSLRFNKFAQSNLKEGRVAALLHTYAAKSPLVTMARPKFAPKSTPFRGPIPKPHYLPHPWTRSTYNAKRHPDPIRRFSTMHWIGRRTHARTYVRTDRQIVHGKVWRL